MKYNIDFLCGLINSRCFLYENHHQNGKTTYILAQSGDSTCTALNSVAEGSKQIRLSKGKSYILQRISLVVNRN